MVWEQGRIQRAFVFELPWADVQVVPDLQVRMARTDRPVSSSVFPVQIERAAGRQYLTMGTELFVALTGRPMDRLDVTLRYFCGAPQDTLFSFAGPFEADRTYTADTDHRVTLTITEENRPAMSGYPDRPFSNHAEDLDTMAHRLGLHLSAMELAAYEITTEEQSMQVAVLGRKRACAIEAGFLRQLALEEYVRDWSGTGDLVPTIVQDWNAWYGTADRYPYVWCSLGPGMEIDALRFRHRDGRDIPIRSGGGTGGGARIDGALGVPPSEPGTRGCLSLFMRYRGRVRPGVLAGGPPRP